MRISSFKDTCGEKTNTGLVGSAVWHTFLDFGILAAEGTGREERRAMDGLGGEERAAVGQKA